MDRIKLLSYGFLFKELPPVFNSIDLGSKYESLKKLTFATNKPIEFSIPTGQYSRRSLQLPHPLNYLQIVEHITDPINWAILNQHFSKSTFTNSRVNENENAGQKILGKDNRATKTNYDNFNAAKKKAIIENFDMLYELKVDISKYYPSIYTHSIVWAILGKNRAKEMWRMKQAKVDESDFPLYDFADKLDGYIRSCQDNQSIGIAIGPDTSHIIAEIIGCYIDNQLKYIFTGLRAYRYFDDYLIYTESEEKAILILRQLQKILAGLQLSVNENKVKITRFPFEFEENWVKQINDVSIVKVDEKSIKQYFSTVFGLAQKYPENSSTIFEFSLRTFERKTIKIDKDNWEFFEALLLKSVLVEPSLLEIASRIFETYKLFISREKITTVLIKLINHHSDLNHHYEIVWSLWIFKQLKLALPSSLPEKIIRSGDNFSILLLLDLNQNNLIENKGLSISLKQGITELLDLQADNTDWLLYYEGFEVNKWISATPRKGFEELRNVGISFYNTNAKIKIFEDPQTK